MRLDRRRAVVNVTAFRGRSPFVTPEDGKNLNRCFPGRTDGTHSEQLAHHVFTELISGSDLLIDLHGGDLVEALEPFTLFDASPVADRAEALARAYGLRYVIRGPEQRIDGTTSAAAADAGIPGITPEAGGCGLMEEDAIRAHIDGLAERTAPGRECWTASRRRATTCAWSAASSGCGPAKPAGGPPTWPPAPRSAQGSGWARCATWPVLSSRWSLRRRTASCCS